MKYCKFCGKELFDEAVICPQCGCAVAPAYNAVPNDKNLLQMLSSRINTNGIIWIAIGALQILGGIFINYFLLIVGVLNIITSVKDMKYSKEILINQNGIVKNYEPIAEPIITLIYNLIFGGIIGVAGSIYYFFAVRGLVMENQAYFKSLENPNIM